MYLAELHRYPVKSMRGEALTAADVRPWGLDGDRRWMVVDVDGSCVTARKHPRLLLLKPTLLTSGIRIEAPDREPVVATPDGRAIIDVSVHGKEPFQAMGTAAGADAWISDYLDTDVRLVYADDPTRRRLDPAFSQPTDCTAFADGYPFSLASLASLDQVNEWIASGSVPDEGPLPVNRFRPNIVITGSRPFAEDSWRRVRIGEAVFRAPKGSARCVLTTTDAETTKRGKEPIATLSRHRRFDGKTWFAMNLICDNPGARLHVGDEVVVLDAVPSDGPPR